jgi:diacylglycerol kinase family enzyme
LSRLDLENILAIVANKIAEPNGLNTLYHWQVREARITADPPQSVQVDGDEFGVTPMIIHSLPAAVQVVTPLNRPLA